MTTPNTIRLSSICRVTSSCMLSVCAVMSPKPTVAKTVTVKYSAVTTSRGSVNAEGSACEFAR